MTDYTKVKIPANYVLVLPDIEHDSYRFKGEETNILVGMDYTSAGQRMSVRGKVYAIPEKLVFNGVDIQYAKEFFSNTLSDVQYIQSLKTGSVNYQVPMEVEVGDIVYFDYLEHYNCYQYGGYIETDKGDMFFMKYDNLKVAHKEGDEENIRPLNGLLVIEKTEPIDGKTESGIIIPLLKKQKNRVGKFSYATVIKQGCVCKGYLDDYNVRDDPRDLRQGDCVVYRPSGAHLLEHGLHQTLFGGKEVYTISRKDLLMVIPKEAEVCIG